MIRVSENGVNHFVGTTESQERNGWKDEPWDDCRKLAVTWRGFLCRHAEG